MIRIGYVGINTVLPSANHTFRLAGYTNSRMLEVARTNILALEQILHWNQKYGISLFRITSQLIPFGSHPINSGIWKTACRAELQRIGRFVRENRMRVSMHPGQFTVLNTPEEQYYINAIRDLEYHNAVLTLMGLDTHHRIVLHGGGAYGNKARSMELLVNRIEHLSGPIRSRLALENDERVFNAEDILNICRQTKVPAILDIFHHEVLPGFSGRQLKDIILDFQTSWPGERQKVHYSNQEPTKIKGAHSDTIDVKAFGRFYEIVKDLDLDIMLEVKDKQASVLKIKSAFPEIQ